MTNPLFEKFASTVTNTVDTVTNDIVPNLVETAKQKAKLQADVYSETQRIMYDHSHTMPRLLETLEIDGETILLYYAPREMMIHAHIPNAVILNPQVSSTIHSEMWSLNEDGEYHYLKNTYVVMVNQAFLDLPANMKKAIIYHEVGHIKANHTKLSQSKILANNIKRLFGSNSSTIKELQADQFVIDNNLGEDLISFFEHAQGILGPNKEMITRTENILSQINN